MAYDASRGRTVVFGGNTAGGAQGDTWEWNGTNWTQRAPTAAPEVRSYHALAYDTFRGRTVLLGGFDSTGLELVTTTSEYSNVADVIGDGHPGGGLSIACPAPTTVGGQLCVTFPSPQSLAFLLLAIGDCSLPGVQLFGGSLCSNPMFLFPNQATLVSVGAPGNPAQTCVPIPNVPSLANLPICVQGLSFELGNCLRATNGLLVRVRGD